MQLTVTGKQIDVGDALRQHVAESLESILEKYFGRATDAGVVFSREAHLLSVQVTVHIGRGIVLASEAKADQPYPAFDEAAQRLASRLRRYKTRLRDHHRTEIEAERARQYVVAPGSDEADAGDAEAVPRDGGPLIVAEMAAEVPTLTVSEAVMRLDLASQSAMLFRNRAHGGLNMVYRRADGNFGWVDPGQAARN
ncbi:ribosomal subunit interface protein [Hypericibacter adhaerens]|uniref:Ribosome hibernation promoting factor n=1 Tax=Hypericibacter adhaerens TaxID=2602016 RepID=A0A5J6MVW9_9PROT|nr:ribosome-associated translation inhibitor RaiA [Hypericibacter adhaerens]QEX20300.1 ribosomal subunit interface protein [Hypericibacter adhaerens]